MVSHSVHRQPGCPQGPVFWSWSWPQMQANIHTSLSSTEHTDAARPPLFTSAHPSKQLARLNARQQVVSFRSSQSLIKSASSSGIG
jgi:hypothetical protein